MQIKVNNCGECPFMKTDEYTNMYCLKLDAIHKGAIYYPTTILENCPIKTEPITIQIKEDETIR